MPRVNLLPQEIIDARRFARTQRVLGGVVLGVAALCGAATLWAQSGVDAARSDLAVTQGTTAQLQSQQVRYAEVPKVRAQLDAARTARERALSGDVLWYRFLTELAVNTPEGAALTSISISMDDGKASTGSQSAGSSLGTVSVDGEAKLFTQVAAWLDDTGRVNGLGGTTLQSATRKQSDSSQAQIVAFTGTAVISSDALSHRYDRKAD